MGTSVAGRVSATAGAFSKEHSKQAAGSFNRKKNEVHSSSLKPTLATPLVSWTLQTQINLRHLIAAGLQSPPTSLWRIGLHDGDLGGEHGVESHNSVHAFRFRRRRRSRDSGIVLTAARGEDATAFVEETAAVEDSKVRGAYLAARSLILNWRLLLITNFVLCGLLWLVDECTRGQECMKRRLERLKMRTEPLRYWAYISCLMFCWFSLAFFLHWQVQRWELSTMVIADQQGVTDGAFDPGGSFCHSPWPNIGLGCQISFTVI
ncbi:hypothetical protein M758_3G187600 [Ceratodon purpureus]|nr:hypothetical protein M758_3G187600 [Ceratodon purpureus]